MLPFIIRWEFSQTPSLAQCNEKTWRTESGSHWLHNISDITKLSSSSQGEKKNTSNFLTLLFYYPIYMYLPSIRIDTLCKGTVFSNLSLNFFLPERAIKDTSIYSLVEQRQLNFLRFSFLHTGNVPSFIMWNGMPHDFSKCTSNICMSGNLRFNNGKALEICISAAGVCLP